MINEQLLKYIRSQREAGIDDSTIKDNLSSAGWKGDDIKEGFQAVEGNGVDANSPQAHQEVRKKATSNRQNDQSSDDNSDTTQNNQKQEGTNQDKYRESVSEEDLKRESDAGGETQFSPQQQSNPASPDESDHPVSANGLSDNKETQTTTESEEIQDTTKKPSSGSGGGEALAATGNRPVRTMEDDRKRAGGGDNRKQKHQVSGESQVNKSQANKGNKGKGSKSTPNSKSDSSKSSSSKSKKTTKQSRKRSSSRKTKNGRRRFAATPDKKQAKKQAARRKKKRSSKGSGSKLTSIAIFVFVLLLVGGGGAYAYFTYFQGPSISATSQQAMAALQSAETFEYRVTIEPSESGESSSYVVEGAVDLNPESQAQTYYTITQSGTSEPPIRAVSSEVSEYSTLDPRKQQVVTETLTSPDFLTIDNFQAQESLAELDTNRFGISLEPTAVVSAYERIHQAVFGEGLSSDIRQQLEGVIGEFTPRRGQMWLDRETNVPYQITLIGTSAEGQSKQINIQFRNHGTDIGETPSYEARSLANVLSEVLPAGSGAESSGATSTDMTDNNQEQSTGSSDTGQQDDSESDVDQEVADQDDTRDALRRDQLRINDVQQLSIALDLYANTNDRYPTSLQQLREQQGQVVSTQIRDPQGGVYTYTVSEEGDRYHLGSTLEATTRENTFNDANYNSEAQGLQSGFDGAATTCGSSSSSGETCYDITSTTN